MRRFLLRAVRNAALTPVVRRQYQPVNLSALQQRFASSKTATISTDASRDTNNSDQNKMRASVADHQAQIRKHLEEGRAREACTIFEQLRKSNNLSVLTADDLQSLIKSVHFAVVNKNSTATTGQKTFMAACAENAYKQLCDVDSVVAQTHSMVFSLLRVCSVSRRAGAVNALIKQILDTDFQCSRDDYYSLIRSCINIGSLDNAFSLYSKMMSIHRPNVSGFDLYLELCERAARKVLSRMTSAEEREKLREGINLQQLASMEEMFERELNNNRGAVERRFDQMVVIYASSGKVEKAQKLLITLVGARNRPPQLSTYSALISAYAINGRNDLALEAFAEVERYYGAEQMPKLTFSLLTAVRLLVEAGQTEKALQSVDWFIESAGENVATLHNNLPALVEALEANGEENRPESLQQKLTELKAKLSKIHSDEAQMKVVNERSFDFRMSNQKLQQAISDGNVGAAMEAFDQFAAAGKYPDMETSEKLQQLLASSKRTDALGRMIRANQKLPPYSLSKTYLETLLSTGMLADAWLFYRNVFRDKAKYTLPTIGNYAQMIQAFVNDQKLDWAAQLLTDLENATKERASKYAVWQPPFQSGVYTTLIQGYTRSGQSGKAMEVFERMAAVDNPLQIPPTIHTYNTLLLAFVRDWNMPAFTELCESLSANTGRPAAPGITESKSNDRQATRELTKARWEEFQRERSSSGVKIPVPSYVSANRVTENLRLLSLVNSNQLDKVPDAYAKSLALSEPPSLVTFEMLAAYHLRRMGRQDFALKSMQRPIAERCVKVLKGEQIQRLGVEATLTTVETCVKEFLQEKQQEAQEN